MVDVKALQRQMQQKQQSVAMPQSSKSDVTPIKQDVIVAPIDDQSVPSSNSSELEAVKAQLDEEIKKRKVAERDKAEQVKSFNLERKRMTDETRALKVSNERLEKENHRLNQLATVKAETPKRQETFGGIFKFRGINISRGKRSNNLFSSVGSTANPGTRLMISKEVLVFLKNFLPRFIGREVVLDEKRKYRTIVSSDNQFVSAQSPESKLVSFVLMAFSLNVDDLVLFAHQYLCAEHNELISNPELMKDFAQGTSGHNLEFDFYVACLAYRDYVLESARTEVGRDDILATLIELTRKVDAASDKLTDVNQNVLADEALTALSVGRDLGIHRLPMQPDLKPDHLDQFLAYKVDGTETEVVRDMMAHARVMAEQLDRRNQKTARGK